MVLYILDLAGVFVFAVSGALAAGRKELDGVGVFFLAFVTSLGGGTIRDVLLNRETVFWVADTSYLWVIAMAAVFTMFYVRFFKPPMKALLALDALGLALFSMIGAQVAESIGSSPIIVVIMAVVTGTAGGVIRDILTNEIPIIFRSTEPLYSVAACGGAVFYILLKRFGVDPNAASLSGMVLVAVLRFSAIIWNIRLPKFHILQK